MSPCPVSRLDESMPNDQIISNDQTRGIVAGAAARFVFRPQQAFVLRHSGFGGCPAFTLLEMLSVIVLLALLVALLLPALSRSKASARQIRCAANLRQLGLAAQMYWDDNNGNAFRYRGAATNHGDLYWFGWLARGNEGAREFDPAPGALFPYLGGRAARGEARRLHVATPPRPEAAAA